MFSLIIKPHFIIQLLTASPKNLDLALAVAVAAPGGTGKSSPQHKFLELSFCLLDVINFKF